MTTAQILEILKLSQVSFNSNFSHKNGSHYFTIKGEFYRVSDHAKPAGTTETYEEGVNDFRSYEALLSALSLKFDMSDKTLAEKEYRVKAANLIVPEGEYFRGPTGLYASVDAATSNMWRSSFPIA